ANDRGDEVAVQVADGLAVVDRRAAVVHADFTGTQRHERLHRSRGAVVDAEVSGFGPLDQFFSLALVRGQCHRQRGDRFACPDPPPAVVCLGLDAHALWRDAQASGDRLTHRGDVRAYAGRLRNDRRVDRDDGVARLADLRSDLAQQLLAVRASETRIVAREVRSEIAEVRRSEDRVHDRVEEHVTIGVASEPLRVLDRDTAQDQAAARREPVTIVPEAGPLRPGYRIGSPGTAVPSRRAIATQRAKSDGGTNGRAESWIAITSASSAAARAAQLDWVRVSPPATTLASGARDRTIASMGPRGTSGRTTTTIRSNAPEAMADAS